MKYPAIKGVGQNLVQFEEEVEVFREKETVEDGYHKSTMESLGVIEAAVLENPRESYRHGMEGERKEGEAHIYIRTGGQDIPSFEVGDFIATDRDVWKVTNFTDYESVYFIIGGLVEDSEIDVTD